MDLKNLGSNQTPTPIISSTKTTPDDSESTKSGGGLSFLSLLALLVLVGGAVYFVIHRLGGVENAKLSLLNLVKRGGSRSGGNYSALPR